ncbi:MAG: DUF4381 domain-containing protein [Cellvibrio sp.]|uniref:DUF4381 domain-containing protein n=1 Tax=Cellvibrio sp. TaxID=1965322 RepID=UPI0031A53D62
MQPTSSPLDQLADIHLPDGVSWWPLAPGWWILLALLVVAAIGFLIWRRRKQQNHYRTLALQELDAIYARYNEAQDAAAYLQALSVLLRRTALTAYPRSFNASIKGVEWLSWLDAVCPALDNKFSGELGQSLLNNIYQKNPQIDALGLQQLSAAWINQHRNHRQKIPAAKKVTPATEANHV